jgi:hypothetical protein
MSGMTEKPQGSQHSEWNKKKEEKSEIALRG